MNYGPETETVEAFIRQGIIPLTKSEQQIDQGQCDRPVRVTPAMIAAGVKAFERQAGSIEDLWDPAEGSVERAVRVIFRSMVLARGDRAPVARARDLVADEG